MSFKSTAIRQTFAFALMLVHVNMAVAQIPGVFDPKGDVKDIIDSFQGAMASLIAQAGGESRVTLVRAFQLSDSLINSLSSAFAGSLNLTFDKLDAQQQKAFFDTRNLIDDIAKKTSDPIKQATDAVNRATTVASDIASWTKKPMITAYFPSFIAPASLLNSIPVTLTGFRLQAAGYDDPKLIIEDKEFPSSQLTDVSLGFVIPRASFATAKSGTSFQKATLILYRDSGGWWPWRKPDEVKFQLLFTILPESLGSFTVSTTTRETKIDVKDYVSTPDLEFTKDGGGGGALPGCYVPPAGYKFDLSTVKPKETKHLAHKDNDHSPGTNTGYVAILEQMETPDRVCINVVASTNCTECGATTAGHLEAKVTKPYDVDTEIDTPSQPLEWKNDVKIPIPGNSVGQTISIKLFDDLTKMGSPDAPPSLPFVDIQNDPRNHAVYLRPRQAWVVP